MRLLTVLGGLLLIAVVGWFFVIVMYPLARKAGVIKKGDRK